MYCVNRDVLNFADGKEAWTYIDSNSSVDIILADVEMPEMDGLVLLKKIKQKYPKKVCIIMSGDPAYEVQAKNLGASGFLSKPFKVNDLFDIVELYVVGSN